MRGPDHGAAWAVAGLCLAGLLALQLLRGDPRPHHPPAATPSPVCVAQSDERLDRHEFDPAAP